MMESVESVRSNGITLATKVWPGHEPTVVAVHGLTANHTCWYPLAEALEGACRLVAYDLRGRGDSDKPKAGYSLADHAADLEGLLDHFGLGRATLMGHSLGAGIGVWFAAHHPERVDRLILLDGGLDVRPEVFESIAPAVSRLGVEFPSLPGLLAVLQTLPMFAGRWNAHLERYFAYDVEPGPTGGVVSKVPRHAIEEEVANLRATRLAPLHGRIVAPTLLLRAPDGLLREDDCLLTAAEAQAMASAIPACRVAVVPGTNHYTILLGDSPVAAREIRGFLDTRRP
jgi:pimeloyl-ACP methyl ester carboxylesterase